MRLSNQLVGNAGLYYVARELSRRGWHVMPTVRNARGADLYAASVDETRVLPIQSKAVTKKRDTVLVGRDLEVLRSPWWILTVNATGDQPVSFILTLEEIRTNARLNSAGGYYLLPTYYMNDVFRNAWGRLGDPGERIEANPIPATV